jgi:hypothetical protein
MYSIPVEYYLTDLYLQKLISQSNFQFSAR